MATSLDTVLESLLAPQATTSAPRPRVVNVSQGREPKFPRRYALYLHEGVQCSGHYDDGTPMPLVVRVEMFMQELDIPKEHNLLIIGMLRSLVTKKEKFLKAIKITPEKSAIMEKFYKNSHHFGIPSPTATEARRFIVSEDDIEKILSPQYLTKSATRPKNELMHEFRHLIPQLERDLGEGFLPNEIVFGPVEIHAESREIKPTELPLAFSEESVKKDTPLKIEEESQPITHEEVEKVRQNYYRSEGAPDQVCTDERIHEEFFNVMSCRSTEVKLKLGFKQDLVFSTRPENGRYMLRTKMNGEKIPCKRVQRGVVIYAPPGHGKTTLVDAYGLSGNLIDTDLLGKIDVVEMQNLIDSGYSLITNRQECVDYLNAQVLCFCFSDREATFDTILLKTEQKVEVVRQWTHDIHKEMARRKNIIWMEPDQHLGDFWNEVRTFVINNRFQGRIKKTRRRYVVIAE